MRTPSSGLVKAPPFPPEPKKQWYAPLPKTTGNTEAASASPAGSQCLGSVLGRGGGEVPGTDAGRSLEEGPSGELGIREPGSGEATGPLP